MRYLHHLLAIFVLTAVTPMVAFAEGKKKDPDLQRVQDSINKDNKPKGAGRTEGGRVSVENKSGVGVYVGGGGKPPSHDNPKGEKRMDAGVQYRFGGSGKGSTPPASTSTKPTVKRRAP